MKFAEKVRIYGIRLFTSIRRRLFSVSLDLHTTGNSNEGFSSGEIGNVDESIVPGGHDVADTEDELVGTNVRRAIGDNFLLDNCDFLRRLIKETNICQFIH